jgi:hypothetical protein
MSQTSAQNPALAQSPIPDFISPKFREYLSFWFSLWSSVLIYISPFSVTLIALARLLVVDYLPVEVIQKEVMEVSKCVGQRFHPRIIIGVGKALLEFTQIGLIKDGVEPEVRDMVSFCKEGRDM